jgi:hypothetical protein
MKEVILKKKGGEKITREKGINEVDGMGTLL